MVASKHTMYLTKNYTLRGEGRELKNIFMFNENGPTVQSKWVQKNLELNDGCFVILDHKNAIHSTVEKNLLKRNYYIEKVDFSNAENEIKINPFDLVSDTSEIHFMFLNFLYAMWDNSDPDLPAMSNLVDAFASCIFFMFENQREKLNMVTLKKMIASVRATCQTEDGVMPMSDAIFAGIKDQNSMPCKYYAQFKKATGERREEVAEKVAQVFDSFADTDMQMMSETDESLADSFNFKTAVFVNVDQEEHEHSARLMLTLLNYFIQHIETHSGVLFILDELNAQYGLVSLPYWMKEAHEHNMSFIVIGNDLAGFKENQRAERFFKNFQKAVAASVLVHHNEAARKFEEELPTTDDDIGLLMDSDYVATVLIPDEEVSEQDELF